MCTYGIQFFTLPSLNESLSACGKTCNCGNYRHY